MALEPVDYQVLVLRVSIHCQGCKKKVKKVLQHVDGVYGCDIDARSNRVAVTASKNLDAGILIARLRKSGKLAEPWPEEPKQQQEPPPPAESQSQETKNQTDDASKPNEAAEKPAPAAAATEPSNAQPPAPEPEKTADETPPPAQESKEAGETKAEIGPQQPPNEANGKAPQQQQHEHYAKPMDAKVTMEFGDARSRGIYGYGGQHQYMPDTWQPPVHVMSYNVARPMASASYYAAAPTPAAMPMPMARPGPSQGGYIDEYAPAPNYYSRPTPPSYEPPNYYYPDPQPSPYRNQRSAEEDYYYGAPPVPQRSAFSPPRDAYGDMFNDENANSCSVM